MSPSVWDNFRIEFDANSDEHSLVVANTMIERYNNNLGKKTGLIIEKIRISQIDRRIIFQKGL